MVEDCHVLLPPVVERVGKGTAGPWGYGYGVDSTVVGLRDGA